MKTNKEILMKFVSTQGYKRNSPDKNRPVNVIPSNQITMQDVDFPVRGVDNLGNEQVMQPGEDYTFPGSYVVETPVAQQGGERTFLNTASQFIPGYETYLDIKDMYQGANQGDKEQLNRGILGVMSPLSGKAVLSAADYLSDKIIGVDATNKNASKRNEILNMNTSDLQKLYIKYGPGGYDKWVADGKPDLNKKHQGGEMIKRADGSYSQRGLWDNIRDNKGSGKKPTKEMLEQERKIKASQKGGLVEPIYVSDKNDPRLKAYTDSLGLYNQGIEPFVHFDDFTGKNPQKEYAKKNYVPGGEGKPVSREQILNEINTIKEELVWQDRPALIKNANDRLALLNKSLETGVYPANLAYPDQPINALVYKKPVVPVEYKKPNTITKEESYKMDNKRVSSEETEKTGGYIYATGGMYDGYMSNPMEVIYAEGGESEQPQMQQGPDIEAAIGQISGMIAQGEDPEDIYDMLIESGVPEEYAQGYMSEAMSDLEEDDMEEEDVPMDDDEMEEYEQDDESEEDMPDDEESEGETEMKRGGTIKIKPSRKGTFKAQATKMGMSVAEAADYILRHKDEFTPAMVKKANFAKNFAKELGGEIYDLAKFEDGGIPDRYRKLGFTRVGAKRRSTRPGKKWMVLAKKGDKYKIIHGGYKGMKDFTQHHNPKRRERFWNRMGGKDSAKARDPFSPLYWHKRFGTWEMGGGVYTKDRMYKAQSGGPAKTYDQWLSENMNRPDIMQNSQSPDYLANMYNMEVSRTPSQTPVQPRMTRTGGSGMGAMEILDPMVPNADNPYDLTLPATPPAVAPQTSKLVAPPGWNAMNNTEGLSPTGTMVQDEPKDRSGFNWRRNAGDIMLGSMGVVNQLKMRKDYEKEYKQRLQRTGNTDQRYNAYTPENPFGNYTLNAGPGSNFALVTNTPMQDFGTRMAGAKYGGTTSYKQGGEYYASDDEIKMILAMGGEIEFLD